MICRASGVLTVVACTHTFPVQWEILTNIYGKPTFLILHSFDFCPIIVSLHSRTLWRLHRGVGEQNANIASTLPSQLLVLSFNDLTIFQMSAITLVSAVLITDDEMMDKPINAKYRSCDEPDDLLTASKSDYKYSPNIARMSLALFRRRRYSVWCSSRPFLFWRTAQENESTKESYVTVNGITTSL